jgi:Bacterial Ig-like domain (group 1)
MALGANLASGVFQVCVPALPPSPVVLSPLLGTDPVGSMHSVIATARDTSGGPFGGLTVNFQVTGANPMIASAVTDDSGIASFRYKGTVAGQDTIVAASLGTNSNVAMETWTRASDTMPPVVTPPANISIPASEAAGARGNASAGLAAFLAGGTAVDTVDPSPARLSPQVGGMDVNSSTLFPLGTTVVTFRFQDASGNIGSATASVTVALGTPRLNGTVVGKGRGASGNYYVDVQITDNGTGNARALQITQLTFRTLAGSGSVTYNSALSGTLPLVLGSLDVGAATTVRFYLNVPSTVTRFSVTQSGTVQDVLANSYAYSQAQSVIP